MANNKLSPVVTLDGLNTVYRQLSDRIKKLGNVYHVKGNKTWAELMALTTSIEGDVYNIIDNADSAADKTRPVTVYSGCNVVCKQRISAKINADEWYKYWDVFEGVLEEATDATPGVIKLGTKLDTKEAGVKEGVDTIVRGLKLTGLYKPGHKNEGHVDSEDSSNTHQAYVDIPIASESTYGVLTTGAQFLKGSKQLKGNLTVDGVMSVKNNNLVANKMQASTMQIGHVLITETNGALSFEYNNSY